MLLKGKQRHPHPFPTKAGEEVLALHQTLRSMEAFLAFLLPGILLESGSGSEL